MPRRTRQDWLAILKEQEASDLNIADYGRRKNISVSSLYARRSDFKQQGLLADSSSSSFVQIATPKKQPRLPTANPLTLEIGSAKLHLPDNVDANWLGQLIKAIHP